MQHWLISDLHLGHQNIYKFVYTDKYGVERRVRERFKDAAEGDAYMIQRWNEIVKPEDHVWDLGDVTMERAASAKHRFCGLIRSLNGHKRLVLGNHDHLPMAVYSEAGYEKIRGSHRIDNLILTHYPIHQSGIKLGLVNCHGHIHQNPSPPGPYINMSVEVNRYEVVALEDVKVKARKIVEKLREAS